MKGFCNLLPSLIAIYWYLEVVKVGKNLSFSDFSDISTVRNKKIATFVESYLKIPGYTWADIYFGNQKDAKDHLYTNFMS